jgi:hypothetical protein
MRFELKDMYSFLISHTFPGLLILVELLFFYQWFINPNFWNFIQENWPTETSTVIVILILGYAFSTLIGIVLDSVHHFIEDIFNHKNKDDKFEAIKDSFSMDVYKHFLEEDLWYPYEAYANVGVAMVPGLFLLYYWLSCIHHFEGLRFWVPVLAYLVTLSITIAEACFTYRRFYSDETEFKAIFSKKQESNQTGE